MKKNSITKNYIYNLIYQLLSIVLPLVTIPYLSRVLHAENIGIFSYTISIVTYFVLFGSLGISMYGQREIAYRQKNKESVTKVFGELFLLRIITCTISIIIFFCLFGIQGPYALFYRILIIQLIASIFDISWFFQGLEEFDKIVVRNLIVKSSSLILIFVLVKNPSDLWKYFTIYVGAELLGNLSSFIYLPKYLTKIKIKDIQLKKHIKPMLILFLPQVAIQIYTVLDKSMLGMLTKNMEEVGFYEQAQLIVKTFLTLITALQTVMCSKVANAYFEDNKKYINDFMQKSFSFVWLAAIPMSLGLIAVAPKFVPWFYGAGFDGVINILLVTTPILIVIALNGITGIQYLVQIGKQNIFTMTVIIGAITNVVLNFILIKPFGGVGAAIASVLAETVILIIQLRYLKKVFKFKEIFKLSYKCWISGLIMFIVVYFLTAKLEISILNTFIEVITGSIIYLLILYLLDFQFLKDIINRIKNTCLKIIRK